MELGQTTVGWKNMLSHYVQVSHDSPINNHNSADVSPAKVFPLTSRYKPHFRSLSTFKIEHKKPIYGSVHESEEILNRNKNVYQHLSSQMQQLENNCFTNVLLSTQVNFKKLKTFKSRFQRFGSIFYFVKL